ncbi:hypothetical protein Pint_21750 [Pistacia integerrima]|uniref:Uncharacterized protein n=1 Tax=Pistacia integerrima TaxID=434235 RepID=A0ACC0XE43_9ROSI|nr:hypothetical protein Pint_21750 [Pistacia integerrima]
MEDEGKQREKKSLHIEECDEESFIPDLIACNIQEEEGEVVELQNPEKDNTKEHPNSKGKIIMRREEEEVVDLENIENDNIEEHVDPEGKKIMSNEQHERHHKEFKYISFRRRNRFQEEKKKFIEILSSGDNCTSSPLELEIPIRQPPSDLSKMMLMKASDVFGIQPRPFDPETYVEEQDENMAVAADDANPKKHFIYQRIEKVGENVGKSVTKRT